MLIAVISAYELARVEFCVVSDVCRRLFTSDLILRGHKIREYIGTVYPLPEEGVIRHFIGLAPTDFGGHEFINAALAEDLRQCRGITEYIGEPKHL